MGGALVVGFPNIMTASATSSHPVCTITRYNQHPPVHQLYQRHKNLFCSWKCSPIQQKKLFRKPDIWRSQLSRGLCRWHAFITSTWFIFYFECFFYLFIFYLTKPDIWRSQFRTGLCRWQALPQAPFSNWEITYRCTLAQPDLSFILNLSWIYFEFILNSIYLIYLKIYLKISKNITFL